MSVSGLHHVDLGSGADPDPDADITVDLHHPNADHSFDVTNDWPLESNSCHTITAHHLLEHLTDLEHVFQEAERCLVPGGRFVVTVPLGWDADSDPDHVHQWTYDTPSIVVDEFTEDRYWDPDTRLTLDTRTLNTGWHGPHWSLNLVGELLERVWPRWTAHNCDQGELQAIYHLPPSEGDDV